MGGRIKQLALTLVELRMSRHDEPRRACSSCTNFTCWAQGSVCVEVLGCWSHSDEVGHESNSVCRSTGCTAVKRMKIRYIRSQYVTNLKSLTNHRSLTPTIPVEVSGCWSRSDKVGHESNSVCH